MEVICVSRIKFTYSWLSEDGFRNCVSQYFWLLAAFTKILLSAPNEEAFRSNEKKGNVVE